MTRDSIHVTMTAQLRQAQVRQRLEALAAQTALPTAHLAGRALAIGLGHLEGDLRLMFPTAGTSTFTSAASTDPPAFPIAPAVDSAAPPAESSRAPAAPKAEQPTAPAADVEAGPTPRAARPRLISSKDAACALNRTIGAFQAHIHRHPDLKRHSKRAGRAAMWDLAKLRAEWGQ